MFDRGKKDDINDGSKDAIRTEPESTFGSLRSKVAGRGGDAAVIGRSIRINGDLQGDEDLRIEGDVGGTVELRNCVLTIGKEGKVKANVYAKSIIVDGETTGDLYATESVSVHLNARVQGNIIAPIVSIEEGAKFKGSIEMDPAAVEKALGKTAPGNASKPDAGIKSGNATSAGSTGKKLPKDANPNPDARTGSA